MASHLLGVLEAAVVLQVNCEALLHATWSDRVESASLKQV